MSLFHIGPSAIPMAPTSSLSAKRAFASAIADKSFIVFKFDVIAVDIDGGQTIGAVRETAGAQAVSAI